MLHPEDQAKLQYVLDWVRGFSGDNVQNLGNTVYVGSGPQRQQPGMENWAPQQFRVKSEENDYLVCVPYDSQTETAGDKEYKVAKAPDHRGDTVRRGVYPRYVPEVSVIWAAPFRRNGAEDGDENPIVLMEVNLDARNAAWFPAKITASSSSSEDHTFVEVTAALADLTDGRTATNAKCLNGRKGVPVGTYVFCLEIQPDDGDPEYYIQIPDGLTSTPKDLVASGASADTTDWDIEVDSQPVNYQPFRLYDDTGNSGNWYYFHRDMTTDASGMVTYVNVETRGTLPGDGYNELRKNNVLVDSVASSGVIDFDDQQTPGTDEVVVQWTLTGDQDAVAGGANDQLRTTVQGVVDLSSVTNGAPENETVDFLIRVDENASTGLKTLDSTDHSGRTVEAWVAQLAGTTLALWQNTNGATMSNTQNYHIGESHTADVVLATGLGSGASRLLIDQSDGSKLKLELNGVPASGFFDFMRIRVKRSSIKATPGDLDFDFNS